MSVNGVVDELPEELRANYIRARKGSAVVECLKVAAALKLWFDRGYREVGFEVPSDCSGRMFYVNVLARDAEGMVGVECASSLHLEQLRKRMTQLRGCLPAESWVILVPSNAGKYADKALELADEVWVTGKDGTVEQMMFMSVFQRG
jgi:predicted metal-binding protein